MQKLCNQLKNDVNKSAISITIWRAKPFFLQKKKKNE